MPVATPRTAVARRPVLGVSARLLVSRFSYGLTPALGAQVRSRGGARAWFEWQLEPGTIRDPDLVGLDSWWPGLACSGAEAWRRNVEEVEPGWVHTAHYQRWLLQRRMRSRRQLLEVMTEFWEHHFNVPANGDAHFVYRKDYGDTIRRHALGSFEELLQATTTHPAMLIYLDQAVSTKAHPNENLGRELLELHTVGRGHHTEDDVKSCARVLTGWRVDLWQTWTPSYQPSSHWTGPVSVVGFTDPNADPDGRDVTRRMLSHLARHPETARRVARKLAVKFVSDDPPEGLVERLAEVYLAEDTRIRPVLRALVDSPEFRGSEGLKIRTPVEDVVAAYRVLGIRTDEPTADASAANAILWQCTTLGAYPQGWPRPDGLPQVNRAWATPARMMASMRVHLTLCGGWWPTVDVRYRAPASWAPDYPIRFDDLVDHLSRTLLHRPATPVLQRACSEALDVAPEERITRDHGLVRWGMPRLLTTFLDSPTFYAR
jgi:hypothetical protein